MPARSPEETHALLEAAINAADVDALVEVYEPNATLVVPPEGELVSGHAAIRHALGPTLALAPTAEFEVVAKLEGDDLALTYGRWRMVGSDPAGDRVELAGRGTIVSRRQPDGNWLIVLDNPLAPTTG